MITNHQAESFKLNANEMFLCGNLLSIFVPDSWSLEREVRSPSGSIASFTKAGVNGDLHLSLATYLNSVNLPSTAKLWVQLVKPGATVENKLELLRESSDSSGHYLWHCALYQWMDGERFVQADYRAHMQELPQLIQIRGLAEPDEQVIIESIICSISLHQGRLRSRSQISHKQSLA